MKKIYTGIAALVLLALGTAKAQTTPTWSDNVACIVYTHCTSCHNPNGIAPFSLASYSDAYNSANAINSDVQTGKMPPWPPDRNYKSLAHERFLTQQEKDIIRDWVQAGAPEGNPVNAPAPPVYTSSYEIPSPDLQVRIPTYTVSSSSDIYRCFVMPTSLLTDRYITGIEVKPGNNSIVHHVLVYQDTSMGPVNSDNADPGPGYTNFGGTGSNASTLIAGWVPGSQAFFLPTGMGIKLQAHTRIIAQIHYPSGSAGLSDSTEIRIRLAPASSTLREVQLQPILNHQTSITDGPFVIPADSIRSFHEHFRIPGSPALGAITVISVAPHMHLIGQSINAFAVTPTHDTIKAINIPNWDFQWQGFYLFRQPIKVPLGSDLYSVARYNNTVSNPRNPNNPPQTVRVGESTTDEMMVTYFAFLYPYQTGDENIVIDTTTTIQYYNSCRPVLDVHQLNAEKTGTYKLFPIPATDHVTITELPEDAGKLEVYNNAGQLMLSIQTGGVPSTVLPIHQLPSGAYIMRLLSGKTGDPIGTQQFVKQ